MKIKVFQLHEKKCMKIAAASFNYIEVLVSHGTHPNELLSSVFLLAFSNCQM